MDNTQREKWGDGMGEEDLVLPNFADPLLLSCSLCQRSRRRTKRSHGKRYICSLQTCSRSPRCKFFIQHILTEQQQPDTFLQNPSIFFGFVLGFFASAITEKCFVLSPGCFFSPVPKDRAPAAFLPQLLF